MCLSSIDLFMCLWPCRWSPCCLGCCVRSCAVLILSQTDSPSLSFGKSHLRERYDQLEIPRAGWRYFLPRGLFHWFHFICPPSRSWASGSAAQSSAPAWSWVTTTLKAWSKPPKRCSLLRSCHLLTLSTPLMRSIRLCSTCTQSPRTSGLNASQEEPSD